MSADRISRRDALRGLSSVGVVSIVGCLGDRQQLTIGVGEPGTRSHQAGHALAVAVDRHSDRFGLSVEPIDSHSQRLYALAEGDVDTAGVDNTTLVRASEDRGVFDLDPIGQLPHQGVAYGSREQYWLAVAGQSTPPDSTAAFVDHVVYPGQPSDQSRLVTEQLLRDAELWDESGIDNRPRADVAAAADQGAVDCLLAVQHSGSALTAWSQSVDEQVGDRLTTVPTGSSLQTAIDETPNAVGREIEPVGWEHAELSAVDGWAVPLQWLWSPSAEPDMVAELTRTAIDHSDTLREVDPLALDGDAETLVDGVMDGLAVHEGAATVFREIDSWNSDWVMANGVD